MYSIALITIIIVVAAITFVLTKSKFSCPVCNYHLKWSERAAFYNWNYLKPDKYIFLPKIKACKQCDTAITMSKKPALLINILAVVLLLYLLYGMLMDEYLYHSHQWFMIMYIVGTMYGLIKLHIEKADKHESE